jgi:GDP-L-fucose synthase
MVNTKVFVAGHRGMVGSAICRQLKDRGFNNLVTRSRKELDLANQNMVNTVFQQEQPDQVYLAAAMVGGIHANNTYPADFIYRNLIIECNVIEAAFRSGVKKVLFLGSSCIYPKFAEQPIKEDSFLTGLLEPTNEPYAIAKIAGIKLCESYNRQYGLSNRLEYRSLMPTNLYGPGDNYHSENAHVIPALIRRFHEAKTSDTENVVVWGSGAPRREFLFVDDLAAACLHVMNLEEKQISEVLTPPARHLNVGFGSDVSIRELAGLIAEVVGYSGKVAFDTSKPDGTPQKLLDSSRIKALGWKPEVQLRVGLELTYQSFLDQLLKEGGARNV